MHANCRGEILRNHSTLWRNGIDHEIEKLVLSPGWSDFHITQLNDSGTMAGFAAKAPEEGEGSGEMQVVLLLPFDIVADTNRDGEVNPVTDATGKDEWSNWRGAIYSVNFDRDGTNEMGGIPMPDAINFGDNGQANFEHYEIVNEADEADITPFNIRAIKGLPEDYKVFLRVDEEESMRAVHIFKKIEAGEQAIWGSYMDPATASPAAAPWVGDVSDPSAMERDISEWINENHPDFNPNEVDQDADGYITFGLEGLVLRGMEVPGRTLDQITGDPADAGKFSGEILIHLEIRDPQDNIVGTDSIRLRVAPWLTLSHRETAEELYIAVHASVENVPTRNAPLNGRYTGLHHTGIMEEIPTPQRWLQDHIEIGYTQRPGGPQTHLVFRLPYNNRHADAAWPYHELLGPDVGLFQFGSDIWDGATDGTHPGGDHGGNLETLPPTQNQPHGVILMGETASAPMRRFIRAQEVQSVGGSFASPAQWLAVGHIDEYSSFLSNRRVLIASSRLGIETLENEIPVNERHLRVLFATDSEVIVGTVTADTPAINSPIITTGRDHLIEEDGVEEAGIGRVAYLRFYSGNARGHVVKAQLHDGHAEVLEWWYTGITIDQYQSAKNAAAGSQWTVAPAIGDEYVLVNGSKRWSGGMPAMITVEEVLAPENINFQNLNRYHIQTKLNQAESAIRAAGGGSGETHFIPVPALFFGELTVGPSGEFTVGDRSAYAFSPGPTNLQPVSGNLYVHRQFGPNNALGEDIYEKVIKNSVQESVFFVDGWDAYHVLTGEIHCGTNVTRTIPDELWWENLPQQQP